MKCDSIDNATWLYLYGELSQEEEERFESHLEDCTRCRESVAGQRRLHQAIGARHEPDPQVLDACRGVLDSALRALPPPGPSVGPLRKALIRFARPSFHLPRLAAAAALVALGFLAARFEWRPAEQTAWTGGADAATAGFRPSGMISGIEPGDAGAVRIALEESRRRVVEGRPEDERIREILLRAARSAPNPGLRVEALAILKAHGGDLRVREALREVLGSDPNPGARLEALDGLGPFAAESATRRALANALLSDDNPGVRVRAIDMLAERRDADLVGVLQRLMDSEENSYVRMRTRETLQAMNASLGTF